MQISQVPGVDSVKLLNDQKIKIITHFHFMQKAVCGACTIKFKKRVNYVKCIPEKY